MELRDSLDGIGPTQLQGFFEGWPDPPSPETLRRLLSQSYRVSLAVDGQGRVVGLAQAVSDGVLTAFVPLLEVLPEHRGKGVGTALMRHLLGQLAHLYAVDLGCEGDLVPFYERLGMQRGNAMILRRYDRQSGTPSGL
ncbi:GNAT family N-acetyltransferase [Deinococcus planocerae]|uniref:GNAT family N-acetyltransferase n=1 Tax=Deinococcus planocerae TaxID=1737569 RepID=UPI000C7EEF1A|nr:GNAT family N-acetyltransferase [Deinococcus planocerae]